MSNVFCPVLHQAGQLHRGLTCKIHGFEAVPGEGEQTGNLKRSYDIIYIYNT